MKNFVHFLISALMFCLSISAILFFISMIIFAGYDMGITDMERQCIKAGVGEYRLIDGTKKVKFFFKGE